MSEVGRRLVRVFWAVDRFLGGERPPTRTQKFTARHPVLLALVTGTVWAAYFLLLPGVQQSDFVIAPVGGFLLGGVLGLTALYERLRQRRLRRRGLWDGS
ncbi:hypothetical protein ABZ656_10265 [Streptomyces sp. NPDC007095]|jgi:uncharacterized membrane protein|uniref:hypothetical protein n=1 Tax=Streptomyces sp. NPDC007095 TaxID=3154482 RepID=UPI000CBDF957